MQLFKALRTAFAGWLDERLPALSLLIALLFLPNYTVFELESGIYDIYTKIRALRHQQDVDPVAPEVVVILVDDEAIRRDARYLSDSPRPLSRLYLANLLTRICDAKPTAVALDVLLDFATEKKHDATLANKLEHAYAQQCPIILAAKLARSGAGLKPVLPLADFLSLEAARKDQLLVGNINVERSKADQVVRRVRAGHAIETRPLDNLLLQEGESGIEFNYLSTGGQYSLSLPVQMLRLKHPELQENANTQVGELLNKGAYLIDFASRSGSIAILSSWEVLAGKRSELLKDKMVIVGVAYSGSTDWHKTPLSTSGLFMEGFTAIGPIRQPYPGSELLAYMYLTLDSVYTGKRHVEEINPWALMLVAILAFAIIQGIMSLIGKPELAGKLVIALLCLYWIISVIAFQSFGLYLAVLRPGAAVIALLLMSRYLRKITRPKE